MSRFVPFSALCIFLTGSISGLTGQSPDKVYQILSENDALEISPSQARTNQHYIALDTNCIPKYFPGNFSGSWNLTAADTMILRIMYDQENLENCGIFDIDLRNRARDLFLGTYIVTTFEPELVDTINTVIAGTSRNALSNVIASNFKIDANEIMVLVHDTFVSLYDADPKNRIIKITDGGLNAHILLHEVGHVLNLPHPVSCCNICTDLSRHFMYDHVSPDATINQIMIQDWLMIINACDGNSLCSDCNDIGMIQEKNNDLYPKALFASLHMAEDPPVSIVDFVNCIDCSVQLVKQDLLRATQKEFKHLCKLLSKQQKLLKNKFKTEFDYYNRDAQIGAKQRKDYIDSQVQRRELFSLERFDVLVEAKVQSLPPQPPRNQKPNMMEERPQQYEKIRGHVQKRLGQQRRVIQRQGVAQHPNRKQPDRKQPGGKQPGQN